ncbi:MAG: hypothetical protein ACLFUX_04535 [Spirochaetaceae bacterium]
MRRQGGVAGVVRAGATAITLIGTFVAIASCRTVPLEERITFNDRYITDGTRMFTERTEVSTRGRNNEHMVGVRAVSESTGYLYYASRQQIERERARVREFGEIYRVDLDTLEIVLVTDPAERDAAIEEYSSFHDFRYHEPRNSGILGDWVPAARLTRERRYSFRVRDDLESGSLPVAVQWVYDREPRRLLLRFGEGDRAVNVRFPPDLFDLSNVGHPAYWRTLSAMRYRADTGHVTFHDSVIDLHEGRRAQLIGNGPSRYVEAMAMTPSWERALVLYWKYRETKYLAVIDVEPPR